MATNINRRVRRNIGEDCNYRQQMKTVMKQCVEIEQQIFLGSHCIKKIEVSKYMKAEKKKNVTKRKKANNIVC
jgi:hypothetical protein